LDFAFRFAGFAGSCEAASQARASHRFSITLTPNRPANRLPFTLAALPSNTFLVSTRGSAGTAAKKSGSCSGGAFSVAVLEFEHDFCPASDSRLTFGAGVAR
jgi:hypothetical protein